MFWATAAAIVSRLTGVAAQFALVRFLSPAEWGTIALANAATTIVVISHQSGMREALLATRSVPARTRDSWVPTLLIASAIGLVLATVGALLRAWGREEAAAPLIWTIALAAPVAAGAVPAMALLEFQLRFRLVSFLNSFSTWGLWLLTWLLMAGGMGVVSYGYAFLGTIAIRTVLANLAVQHGLMPPSVSTTAWGSRRLGGPAVISLLAALVLSITWYGDYIIVRIVADASTLGFYFLAFTYATQPAALLAASSSSVLLPILSRSSPASRTRLFFSATKILAHLFVALSLVQFALARPIILHFAGAEWASSVPMAQLLCLAVPIRYTAAPAAAFLQSHGRFVQLLRLNVAYTTLFLLLIIPLGVTKGVSGVVAATVVYFLILGPVHLYQATRQHGATWRTVVGLYLEPFAVCGVAVTCGALSLRVCERLALADVGSIITSLAVAAGTYLLTLKLATPKTWRSIGEILVVERTATPSMPVA